MRIKAAIAATTLLFAGAAMAENQHGIEVYPAAKADAETAQVLKEKMKLNASTYRTTDSVEKVTAFYRKQKLEEMPGASKEGAMFTGKAANVTIQNPWADMKTGKINNDTLISIVKK